MAKWLSNWRREWTLSGVSVMVTILLVVGYSWSRARNLIQGPNLTVNTANNLTLTSPLVRIEGEVERVSHLKLNGGKIFADAGGHFAEPLLLYPGYNVVKLEAEDRFGRQVVKYVKLAYQPKE